jgi:hypothetical protein
LVELNHCGRPAPAVLRCHGISAGTELIGYLFINKDVNDLVGVATTAYSHSVHKSTGFTLFKLALFRIPHGTLAPTRHSTFWLRENGFKKTYRYHFLARAAKLFEAAREKNLLQLGRYKRIYDHKVKSRHKDLQLGDSVLIRTYMLEPARSPKLSFPVAGPYPVIGIDGNHTVVRTREGTQRHHLDRIIRAPISELPPGVELVPSSTSSSLRRTSDRSTVALSSNEYVDRLVSHAQEDDGSWLIRVRWAGFDSSEDTWEPVDELPKELVNRYCRK